MATSTNGSELRWELPRRQLKGILPGLPAPRRGVRAWASLPTCSWSARPTPPRPLYLIGAHGAAEISAAVPESPGWPRHATLRSAGRALRGAGRCEADHLERDVAAVRMARQLGVRQHSDLGHLAGEQRPRRRARRVGGDDHVSPRFPTARLPY